MNRNIIYELHKKEVHGKNKDLMLEICWNHCQIVEEISLEIANRLIKKGIKVDKELVSLGALIHDIGTYRVINENLTYKDNGIIHGEIGYKIAIENNISKEVSNFCLTHLGVGMTKEEIEDEKFPLDIKLNHLPLSIEEKIVAYADNFHSKGRSLKFRNLENVLIMFDGYTKSQKERLTEWVEIFGDIDLKKYIEKYSEWQNKINKQVLEIRQE